MGNDLEDRADARITDGLIERLIVACLDEATRHDRSTNGTCLCSLCCVVETYRKSPRKRGVLIEASALIAIRDALVRDDVTSAYHALRMAADPDGRVYTKTGSHWSEWEHPPKPG